MPFIIRLWNIIIVILHSDSLWWFSIENFEKMQETARTIDFEGESRLNDSFILSFVVLWSDCLFDVFWNGEHKKGKDTIRFNKISQTEGVSSKNVVGIAATKWFGSLLWEYTSNSSKWNLLWYSSEMPTWRFWEVKKDAVCLLSCPHFVFSIDIGTRPRKEIWKRRRNLKSNTS